MTGEMQVLQQLEIDNNWFRNHYTDLQSKYKNQFIAVKDKSIIEHANSLEELLSKLSKRGIDASNILIEFILEKGKILIL